MKKNVNRFTRRINRQHHLIAQRQLHRAALHTLAQHRFCRHSGRPLQDLAVRHNSPVQKGGGLRAFRGGLDVQTETATMSPHSLRGRPCGLLRERRAERDNAGSRPQYQRAHGGRPNQKCRGWWVHPPRSPAGPVNIEQNRRSGRQFRGALKQQASTAEIADLPGSCDKVTARRYGDVMKPKGNTISLVVSPFFPHRRTDPPMPSAVSVPSSTAAICAVFSKTVGRSFRVPHKSLGANSRERGVRDADEFLFRQHTQ